MWLPYLLLGALTAVWVGYWLVWLPGPGAGLQFLGVEVAEFVKFMGVGPVRNWFYWPPISLALLLLLLTLLWSNGRWQTWLVRGVAVAISLLAFPAYEDLTSVVQAEYLPRVVAIGVVVVVTAVVSVFGWLLPMRWRRVICWGGMLLLGLVGAIMPWQVYGQIMSNLSQLFGVPVGVGWGMGLNIVGHLLVAVVAAWQLGEGQK